jgi:hypothetical protein
MGFRRALLARTAAGLGVSVVGVLAWRAYGWAGLALGLGAICFWALLHMSRMLVVLRRTASQPVGSVASAVMLQSRLRAGMPLLQVLALTQSLGRRLDAAVEEQEVYQWSDPGGDLVHCAFANGKLVRWNLQRR